MKASDILLHAAEIAAIRELESYESLQANGEIGIAVDIWQSAMRRLPDSYRIDVSRWLRQKMIEELRKSEIEVDM